ncbi:hypothetical protein SB48_HM08orf02890 [Heyndrickxia coagulans]|uniref:Uncharacterized protein n=1 Tax=Heyndrickxia coagulans TaxID=1398 RepID=A0AAN0T6B3_HEYCO|nr:hypothetical protein SB48_HM08orf02890 [Heyndrickxia coagulans]
MPERFTFPLAPSALQKMQSLLLFSSANIQFKIGHTKVKMPDAGCSIRFFPV